ncbi:MAG: hypothetical protein ATN31_07930 [Candidatus Epulonipiscioides saccharophilum]|nr:MAG: hypothetical protein ATN31_07930 [Epulopiscium sp. AS2M-Bin001]
MKKRLAVTIILSLFFIRPHVDNRATARSNTSRAIFVMAPLNFVYYITLLIKNIFGGLYICKPNINHKKVNYAQ